MLVKVKIALDGAMEKIGKGIHQMLNEEKGEIGIGVILGIAATFIIFGFIVIPQGRSFATTMFTNLINWYNKTIDPILFPTS